MIALSIKKRSLVEPISKAPYNFHERGVRAISHFHELSAKTVFSFAVVWASSPQSMSLLVQFAKAPRLNIINVKSWINDWWRWRSWRRFVFAPDKWSS